MKKSLPKQLNQRLRNSKRCFLYAENHSLGEWFKRRLVPIMETKNSLC